MIAWFIFTLCQALNSLSILTSQLTNFFVSIQNTFQPPPPPPTFIPTLASVAAAAAASATMQQHQQLTLPPPLTPELTADAKKVALMAKIKQKTPETGTYLRAIYYFLNSSFAMDS